MLAAWVEGGEDYWRPTTRACTTSRVNYGQDGGALQKVLGVEMKGEPLRSQPECYLPGEGKACGAGRIRARGDCGRGWAIGAGGSREGATTHGGMLESGDGGGARSGDGGQQLGQGRTIYISGSLEANYLYDRVESTAAATIDGGLLGRGLPQPFKLKAPQGVYGVLRRATNGDLVLWVLANVGFKDAAAGRMRQTYIPVKDVELSVRVPEGRRVKEIRLVRADRQVPFQEENGYVLGHIPTLHIAEIVHVMLG